MGEVLGLVVFLAIAYAVYRHVRDKDAPKGGNEGKGDLPKDRPGQDEQK